MAFMRAAAAALTCCASMSLGAAPLNYDESVSGDLAGQGTVTELWLGLGQNTINGHMHAQVRSDALGQPEFDSDFDPVVLHVPVGQRVTGISLSIQGLEVKNAEWAYWAWFVLTGDPFVSHETCFAMLPSAECSNDAPTGGPLAFDPATASNWLLITNGSSWLWQDQQDWSGTAFNYTLTLQVAQIPEPASISLAAMMLAGAGAATRRRRRTLPVNVR